MHALRTRTVGFLLEETYGYLDVLKEHLTSFSADPYDLHRRSDKVGISPLFFISMGL